MYDVNILIEINLRIFYWFTDGSFHQCCYIQCEWVLTCVRCYSNSITWLSGPQYHIISYHIALVIPHMPCNSEFWYSIMTTTDIQQSCEISMYITMASDCTFQIPSVSNQNHVHICTVFENYWLFMFITCGYISVQCLCSVLRRDA